MTATPMLMQVDVAALYSAAADAYYANADRRITSGLRFALELLGIPLPPYAVRSAGGRPPNDPAKAFFADNPANAAAHRLSKARRAHGRKLQGDARDQLDSLRRKAARRELAAACQ